MENNDVGGADPPAPDSDENLKPLRWPPPGLARLHGDVYGAARWLGAGAILILPLLWAIVAEQAPWSLGPLGDSLWLAFLLGIVGIPVLVGGYVVLTRLFRRASQAVGQGHHWRIVALVATDHRRDTGFLLQGARAYGLLSAVLRRRLATNRITVGALILFAALWLSLGFGISVVLAARGVLGPWGVVAVNLGPSAMAGVVAMVAYGWEEGVLRKCRRRWYKQSWSQELVRDEIREWQAAMSERAAGVPHPEATEGGRARTALRASYIAVGVAMVAALVPVFTLILSAAIIPVLARISVPEYERTVAQFASAEPLRAYVLEPDPSLSAADAGAILHTLSFVGRPYRATEGVLPPRREYEDLWFPTRNDGGFTSEWIGPIVEGLGRPLPSDEQAYLERVADHRAHREVARLARAQTLDIAGVRWSMPLPSDITMAELSMPSMGQVRDAAYAHLVLAAVQAADGRSGAAETTIREVLSVGFLLSDESPSVLDNLIGLVIVGLAGDALQALYRNTGHPDANALAWGLTSAERSVERARPTEGRNVEAILQAMPQNALDSTFVRGVRWEYLGLLNTLGPCMNLQRVVFGPGVEYRNWLQLMEDRLVRYPAERELFEVARGGLLGRDPGAGGFSTRILALTMGDADRPGSCARVLGEVVGF